MFIKGGICILDDESFLSISIKNNAARPQNLTAQK